MCNVLVWGACGFLGWELIPRLLQMGLNVAVLTRPRSLYGKPSWAGKVKWHEVSDSDSCFDLFMDAVQEADLIYNLAGSSGAVDSNRNPLASLNGNCAAQLRFLMACQTAARKPHVVFASSRLVYEPSRDLPVSEVWPTNPKSMYGAHKLCVEHYHRIFALQNAITYTIMRISNVYGPGENSLRQGYQFINGLIRNACRGVAMSLFGDGTQVRDYIYVADVIEAFLLCGLRKEARNEIFNIGTGWGVSLYDACITIQAHCPAPIVSKPWPAEYAVVEAGDFVADISKVRRVLGFVPSWSLRDGVLATVAHFKQRAATLDS